MWEAAEALAEFRHILPEHSPEANAEVELAREHFDRAIALLCKAPGADEDLPPRMRSR
jgi:hypothetical protein